MSVSFTRTVQKLGLSHIHSRIINHGPWPRRQNADRIACLSRESFPGSRGETQKTTFGVHAAFITLDSKLLSIEVYP